MTIKIPELPALSSRVPTEVRNALIKLHQALKSADASGGLATAADVSGASSSIASDVADAIAEITTGPSAVPGSPVNFTVTGGYNQIFLQADPPNTDDYVEYTEFLRATVDDPNQAEVVARIQGVFYPDVPPDSSTSVSYFYWARFVNIIGTGPLNATAGTLGSTASDPSYLLEVLAGELGYEQFDVANGVFPTRVVSVLPELPDANWPEGSMAYLTTDGKVYRTDGTVWTQKIETGDLDGTIEGNQIAANAIDAGKIQAGAIIAEKIGTNEIITNAANIANAVITSAKIQSVAADKITAGTITALISIVGGMLRSSDSLVYLDMASKTLKMQDASSGDYVQMTPGDLWFVYNQDVYKSLRRIVAGYGSNNTYIPFDPPFKTVPTVILSQRNLMSYNAGESGASQSIVMNPGTVTKNGFTPLAQLVFSGQSEFYYDTTDDIATNGNYAYANTGIYADVTRVGARVTVGEYVCDETPDSGIVCNWTNIPDRIRLYYSYDNSNWTLFHDETITGSNFNHNWSLYGTHTFYTPTLTSNKIYIRLIVNDNSSLPSATLIGLYVTRSGYSSIASGDINYIAIEGGY